jgi:hypothetical protein
VLFTAFPPAFAALMTALHVPLTLMSCAASPDAGKVGA